MTSSSILDYFRREQTHGLVNPKGPTSLRVLSSSISAANKAVEQLQKRKMESAKQGQYLKLTDEQKAKIAQYALQNGNSSAVRHRINSYLLHYSPTFHLLNSPRSCTHDSLELQ